MRDHVRHIRSGGRSGRVVDPDPRRLNDLTVPRHAVPYREPARNCPSRRTLPDRPLTMVHKVSQDGRRGSRDFRGLFVAALLVMSLFFSVSLEIFFFIIKKKY